MSALEPARPIGEYLGQHSPEHRVAVVTRRLLWPEDRRSGPLVPFEEDSAHRLWGRRGRSPQWPWTILVFADGTVEQNETPSLSRTKQAQYALVGGRAYDIEVSSWLYATLEQAGYEFEDVEAP